MPKKRNRKQLKLRRSKPHVYIFCEGEVSEPQYLKRYVSLVARGNEGLVKVLESEESTGPSLVDHACAWKEGCAVLEPMDSIWVVFDRESPRELSNEKFVAAWGKAREHGIQIAISNVCFEVWLLLHFKYTTAPYSSCDDLERHSPLKSYIPDYEHACDYKFSLQQITTARKNAIRMNKATQSGANVKDRYAYQWNPYTDIPNLLDALDVLLVGCDAKTNTDGRRSAIKALTEVPALPFTLFSSFSSLCSL